MSYKSAKGKTTKATTKRKHKEIDDMSDNMKRLPNDSDEEEKSLSDSTKFSKGVKPVEHMAVHKEEELIKKNLPNKYVKHYSAIASLINEFNCSSNDNQIYRRNYEKDQIKTFIDQKYENSESGLMYVCGHPGTGKTSIIRVILQEIYAKTHTDDEYRTSIMVFNYNGMIFKRLYEFSTQLIKDIRWKLKGKDSKNIESKLKQTDDVTDLGHRIQKYFLKFKNVHKLIIIDEVDNLSMTESAKNFISFLNSILKSDTNTTIIGIANSTDLVSKVSQFANKDHELVESKCIFAPYSEEDITKIIEKKVQKHISANPKQKQYLDNLFEKDALRLTAKKVSKISGDIRVAFDLIKSALVTVVLAYKDEATKLQKKDDN